jgi:hypothetical protein
VVSRPAPPGEGWDAGFIGRSPLLEPLAAAAAPLGALPDWPGHEDLNRLPSADGDRPCNARGLPLRFVPPPAEPARPYELQILESGAVPTRAPNWHDLFNALVWLTFPLTKAALNARHCAARSARAPGGRRSPVEDALTGFDESGVVVACGDERLETLLRGFRWKELFWERREEVRARMGFYLFGHGLCEAALRPFVGMTGKGVVLSVDSAWFGAAPRDRLRDTDRALAAVVADPRQLTSARVLAPVPVLGVPGWWPANEAESFYDNTAYFRPGRGRVAG